MKKKNNELYSFDFSSLYPSIMQNFDIDKLKRKKLRAERKKKLEKIFENETN